MNLSKRHIFLGIMIIIGIKLSSNKWSAALPQVEVPCTRLNRAWRSMVLALSTSKAANFVVYSSLANHVRAATAYASVATVRVGLITGAKKGL
jgi:hypothetical protein